MHCGVFALGGQIKYNLPLFIMTREGGREGGVVVVGKERRGGEWTDRQTDRRTEYVTTTDVIT